MRNDAMRTLCNILRFLRNETDLDVSIAWERAQRLINSMEDGKAEPNDRYVLISSLVHLRYKLSKLELKGMAKNMPQIRKALKKVKRAIKMIGKLPVYDSLIIYNVDRPTPESPSFEVITEVICKLMVIHEDIDSIPYPRVLLEDMLLYENLSDSTLWKVIKTNPDFRKEVYEVYRASNPLGGNSSDDI